MYPHIMENSLLFEMREVTLYKVVRQMELHTTKAASIHRLTIYQVDKLSISEKYMD